MSYPIPDQFFIDSSQGLLISTGITTALACAIVLFRIYARGWVTMSTDGDDYTMWMATGLSALGMALIIGQVHFGTGRYGAYLPPEDLKQSLLLVFISRPVYIWGLCFIKVSITLCLLRFSPSKAFTSFLLLCLAFLIMIALIYFGVLMLQCQPLAMVWDPTVQGTCMPKATPRAVTVGYNSISLFIDVLLAILPIPMIWNLQVRIYVKISIAAVMGMAALQVGSYPEPKPLLRLSRAAAACAARMWFLAPKRQTGDRLYDTVNETIWYAVECNIGITAASVPAILPLIRKTWKRIKGVEDETERTVKSFANKTSLEQRDLEQGNRMQPRGKIGGTIRKTSIHTHRLSIGGRHMSLTSVESTQVQMEIDLMDEEDVTEMYASASRAIARRHAPFRRSDTFIYTTKMVLEEHIVEMERVERHNSKESRSAG